MLYRKRPVVVEAVQFTGQDSLKELMKFCPIAIWHMHSNVISIPTLEGIMTAQLNDWIIKGVKGEFYPVKPDVFKETYEPVNASQE